MNLTEAKLHQLVSAATYRVYGHSFDIEEGGHGSAAAQARKRWRGVTPCLCVQDSPANPCPCDTGMLWWLSEDSVVAHGNSGRKDHNGKELQFFDVLLESKIMIETIRPVSAGTLKGLGNHVSAAQILDLAAERGGSVGSGTIQKGLAEEVAKIVFGFLITELLGNWRISDWIEKLLEEEKKKKQQPQ